MAVNEPRPELAELQQALLTWQTWLREHLDALPAEDEDWDWDDDGAVLTSLRYVIDLHPGCTEAEDYGDSGRWEAMEILSRALAVSR